MLLNITQDSLVLVLNLWKEQQAAALLLPLLEPTVSFVNAPLYEIGRPKSGGHDHPIHHGSVRDLLFQAYFQVLHRGVWPPHKGVEQAFVDCMLFPNSHLFQPNTLMGFGTP